MNMGTMRANPGEALEKKMLLAYMVFHNVSFSFIHCHPVCTRLVLLPSAVSVSNQLSLWSAGGTLGLDVPVRNIPT